MRKTKKIIALTMAFLIVSEVGYAQNSFEDMDKYEWAKESVNYLYDNGVIKGISDTKFAPSLSMKRGDFALMVSRYFKLSDPDTISYDDMASDTYYAFAAENMKRVGGYNSSDFKGEESITREDAIAFIYYTIYNTNGVSEEDFSDDASKFYSDFNEIKWDKINAVATLTNMGIIEGADGKFMPKRTLTRAEVAVIFYNLYEIDNTKDTTTENTTTESVTPIEIPAVLKVTESTNESGMQYNSKDNNQSVVFVSDTDYTVSSSTISKNAGQSSDIGKTSEEGLNSAFISKNAKVQINNTQIMSSPNNSPALFADKSDINVSGSSCATLGSNSPSVASSNGSSVIMQNARLSTAGQNSAAVWCVEGSEVLLNNTFIMTEELNSSGITAMGKVTANSTTISNKNAYSAVVNASGSISSTGSSYSGKGILICWDEAEETKSGCGNFFASNSKISANGEAVFVVTNTDANISLINTEIVLPSNKILINASSGEWGTDDANGGHVILAVNSQKLTGDIVTDGISSVEVDLTANSVYNGAVNTANYTGAMNISLDSTSSWSVGADSYLTALTNEDLTCSNIISNGHNVFYDPAAPGNAWLEGRTIDLNGGGTLKPVY